MRSTATTVRFCRYCWIYTTGTGEGAGYSGYPIEPDVRGIINCRFSIVDLRSPDPPADLNDVAARKQVLQQLVNGDAKAGFSPAFELRESEGRLHVVPTRVRDQSGVLRPISPLLDTRVAIPVEQRNGNRFIHDLVDAISQSIGRQVIVGITPANILAQYETSTAYENLPARQVLEEFLKGMPRGDRCAWQFLCQGGTCVLNLHVVLELNHYPGQGFFPLPPDRPERSHTVKKMPTVGPKPPAAPPQ